MKAQLINNELMLHGPVGFSFFDEDGLFAADVRAAVAEFEGDEMDVFINSGGGVATEGAAILAVLDSIDAKITMHVEGIAASAASLIAMAGDEIVMEPAALLMIHDPSGVTIGTAETHRTQADVLDTIADVYAKAYARKSGNSPEEMREMMKAEVWLDGAAAVEANLADTDRSAEESDAEASISAFPYELYTDAPDRLVAMASDRGWRADALRTKEVKASRAGREQASKPQKEADMATKEKTAVDSAAETKTEDKKPQIDPKAQAALEAQGRREAVMAISADKLTAAEVETIVAEAKDPADAKMAAVDLICEKRIQDEGPPTKPSASVTDDEQERNYNARVEALRARMFGGRIEGAAEQFRNISPKRVAMELGGGQSYTRSEMDTVKAGMSVRGVLMAAGMHSTSDFTYLMADTINRQLRADYEARPGTWRRISRQRSASDFRTLYSVQSGADVEMKKVNEAGEYESTVLTDAGESFAVERFGREVHLTFEAIVNDDLSAFERLPSSFARGALNLESRIAWGLINANGNLSDGVALFANNAARGRNLAASGAAISATTVGAGRKVMWEQRPLGAKSTGDDFISAEPNLLYVPPALEITALQFTTATTPETDGNVNPFKSTLEPIVETRLGAQMTGGSDTAWYLFDGGLPVLEHAFLDGFEAPMVEPEENRNPKGVTFTAEHIFGAGAVEFRGAYKNAGA